MTRINFVTVTVFALFFSTNGFPNGPGVYQLTDPIDHAESPTWDTRNSVLYYVNIHQGEIYRYSYDNNTLFYITLPGEVAPAIPSKNNPNIIIAGLDRSVVAVEWYDPSQIRNLTTVSAQFPTSRFNDGKADREGRLWIGTMGYEGPDGLVPDEGVFYEVTRENVANPDVVLAPLGISNGIAFNRANDKMYHIDTVSGKVREYPFNVTTGEIQDENARTAFEVSRFSSRITGGPDGMTIDSDDNIWVALWGGGAVVNVDPRTGDLLQVVPIPALDVTSVMWGGPELDVLFVTTSRYSLSEEERKQQPAAGSVFAIVGLGAKGVPVYGVDLV